MNFSFIQESQQKFELSSEQNIRSGDNTRRQLFELDQFHLQQSGFALKEQSDILINLSNCDGSSPNLEKSQSNSQIIDINSSSSRDFQMAQKIALENQVDENRSIVNIQGEQLVSTSQNQVFIQLYRPQNQNLVINELKKAKTLLKKKTQHNNIINNNNDQQLQKLNDAFPNYHFKDRQDHNNQNEMHLNEIWRRNALIILLYINRFICQLKENSIRYKFKSLSKMNFRMISDKSCSYSYYKYRQMLNSVKTSAFSSKLYFIKIKLRSSYLGIIFSKNRLFSLLQQFIRNNIIIIQPDSFFKLTWDFLVLFLIIANNLYIPFKISFFEYYSKTAQYVIGQQQQQILDTYLETIPSYVFIIDIILNFNTAVYRKGVLITNRVKIIKIYFRNSLLFDLVTVLSFMISLTFDVSYLELFLLLRFKKIMRLINSFAELLNLRESQIAVYDLFKLIMLITYVAHLAGCGFHYIAVIEKEYYNIQSTWLSKLPFNLINQQNTPNNKDLENISQPQDNVMLQSYVSSVYWALITMITVGYGDISPITMSEQLYVIVMSLFSCGLFAYSINTVGTILQNMQRKSNEFKSKMALLTNHMRKRCMGLELQMKVKKYFQYLYEEELANNEEGNQMINMLPNSLKQEVYVEMYGKILQQSKLFSLNFSKEFLRELSLYLKEKRLGPEEIIFTQGECCDKIFFLMRGEVELFIKLGIQKCTTELISNQKAFGQRSFFTGQLAQETARCVNVTQLVYINKSDFLTVIKKYQLDFEKFTILRDKFLYYNSSRGLGEFCPACSKHTHQLKQCRLVLCTPNKEKFIYNSKKQQYEQQPRQNYSRNNNRFGNSIGNQQIIKDCVMQFIIEYINSGAQIDSILRIIDQIEEYHKQKYQALESEDQEQTSIVLNEQQQILKNEFSNQLSIQNKIPSELGNDILNANEQISQENKGKQRRLTYVHKSNKHHSLILTEYKHLKQQNSLKNLSQNLVNTQNIITQQQQQQVQYTQQQQASFNVNQASEQAGNLNQSIYLTPQQQQIQQNIKPSTLNQLPTIDTNCIQNVNNNEVANEQNQQNPLQFSLLPDFDKIYQWEIYFKHNDSINILNNLSQIRNQYLILYSIISEDNDNEQGIKRRKKLLNQKLSRKKSLHLQQGQLEKLEKLSKYIAQKHTIQEIRQNSDYRSSSEHLDKGAYPNNDALVNNQFEQSIYQDDSLKDIPANNEINLK